MAFKPTTLKDKNGNVLYKRNQITMELLVKILLIIFIVLPLIVGFGMLFGWLFSLAWGFTVVPLFGWPAISLWQGWAILFMFGLIGQGFRSATNKD